MLYFATHHLQTGSGVMVTGSHNPPDYNGMKIVVAGETLSGDAIQALRNRIETGELASGSGSYSQHDIAEAYIERIVADVKLARPMRIVVDCGNGVAGAFAPQLYRRLGCRVRELFCEVDGNFPNHHPDPSQPDNLQDLIRALAVGDDELGLAFDGDGDRLGVVTKAGKIIYPDRQLMLFAADVLSRNPGAQVIFDVKSTRNLFDWIASHGGKPVLWKTGHSLIKAKMKETGALLAGEMSGHTFFKERWYGFDDGLYAGARLLEYLSARADIDAEFARLPDSVNTPELQIQAGRRRELRADRAAAAEPRSSLARAMSSRSTGCASSIADGFGLARASNTTPVIVLRFEADNAGGAAQDPGRLPPGPAGCETRYPAAFLTFVRQDAGVQMKAPTSPAPRRIPNPISRCSRSSTASCACMHTNCCSAPATARTRWSRTITSPRPRSCITCSTSSARMRCSGPTSASSTWTRPC